MSRYDSQQAAAKAKQIYDRFGPLVREACAGSIVPEDFLGGFVGVEAGIDHHGNISPDATRFEPGVYRHLIDVRDDREYSWSKITRGDLAGLSDDAIRNLATSWCLTQIMGWHMVHDLKGSIEDLRDIDKHLKYAVELLIVVGRRYELAHDWTAVLHIWNSGSPTGKTYDPDYVPNALAVKAAYARLIATNGEPALPAAPNVSAAASSTTDPESSTEDAPANTQPEGVSTSPDQPPTPIVEDVVDTPAAVETDGDGEDPKTAPETAAKTAPETWGQRATDLQGKLDQMSSFKNSLSPFTPSLSPISGTSATATWSTKIIGWLTFAFGFLSNNWIYLVVGVVLVAIALAYLAMAKRNAAKRAGDQQVQQSQTMVVKT